MGVESYEGGIGGFVFACPVSGTIKTKIYSTLEQYPAVLYQILQEVESEGYVYLSLAAEDVAAIFKVRIIPISGGTPQELAYAESAVRTLGQMSHHLAKSQLGESQIKMCCSYMYSGALANTNPPTMSYTKRQRKQNGDGL
jgi:hypothetical protein